MKAYKLPILINVCIIICFLLSSYSCEKDKNTEIIGLTEIDSLENAEGYFAGFYSPVRFEVDPGIEQYTLPFKGEDIQNYKDITTKLLILPEAEKLIKNNGFVVVPWGKTDDMVKAYRDLKKREIPVFVTSDTLMHLYHIQFDETLKGIEEKEFYRDLISITKKMLDISVKQYEKLSGDLRKAAEKNIAYFSIVLKLLLPEGQIPVNLHEIVESELELINAHEGFSESPLFNYREDYSQYVPRGHYTRSEELERYFMAMMYYGRMVFLLKGHRQYGPISPPAEALISPEESKLQTLQAMLISINIQDSLESGRTIAEAWNRIYLVTAFYSGFSDDLSLYDYRGTIREVFGETLSWKDLLDEDKLFKLKKKFALLPSPRIYGGTGESGVIIGPGDSFKPEHLDEILENTKGMRFMGQRFVPDSYMFSHLVSPAAGDFTGENAPFTMVEIPGGKIRGFPRGLDIMSILGSKKAEEILREEGDKAYTYYDKQYEKLESEFAKFDENSWNRNLYWSWLYALRILVNYDFSGNHQAFMKTSAWIDKELNLSLASWSSLRHDTILYAKQSYTPTLGTTSAKPFPPPPKPVVGYVEPVPELYAHLLAMTKMTNHGLKELDVLDEESEYRLSQLEIILEKLLDISVRELNNEELAEKDYDFIRNFGENLENTVASVDTEGIKTTIIADVHTDQNTQKVLEEGTGYVNLIIAAYELPDGRILLGAGPVLSYYEFKHPLSDRLTDQKWQEMLASEREPSPPEWTGSFYISD